MRAIPRKLKVLLAGSALLMCVPVAVIAITFGGLEPSVDGTELPGGARLVRGGISNAYVVPTGAGVVFEGVSYGPRHGSSATTRARAARRCRSSLDV